MKFKRMVHHARKFSGLWIFKFTAEMRGQKAGEDFHEPERRAGGSPAQAAKRPHRCAPSALANTLITREKLGEIRVQNERAAAALESAVRISTDRYVNGRSSYYEVLEAMQQLYPTQRALAQTQLNQLLVIVQPYKALGGRWWLGDNELSSHR